MRIVLVHMPWGAIDMPSLALGILRATAERAGHEVDVHYANLDFVDWVTGETDFNLSDYLYFSDDSYFQGAGDWVFAAALYGEDSVAEDSGRYLRFLADNGAKTDEIALVRAMRALAPRFITRIVASLADQAPDVVGFTTTFQQNTASLAAAKLLKQACPRVRVVLGGANCDGAQGAALHRNFPFLDYVVRGEGETAFPALLNEIDTGTADLSGIVGLCWRDGSGASVANPMSRQPLPPAAILSPTYDGFFDRIDESVAACWVEPKLVVEGSRGCWWGEKHHCTFCGLNGSFMQFRSKQPSDFLAEVLHLAQRHQLLDFYVVDNILDMGYFDTVLRALAASDFDLRLHFEVKANLRRHQFQILSDSGAVQVQPGIESLSTHVLQIMDKGVTGCQNVRALRDAQSTGVTTSWNYLYGFPGETAQDYASVIRQLPMLHHLDPPIGSTRITIERFSPYFDRPELGFDTLQPAPQYTEIYQLPESELTDLAYLFSAPSRGIDNALTATLTDAIDAWRADYPISRLSYQELDDRIVLVNSRPAYDWSVLELTDPVEVMLFRLLAQPRSLASLTAKIACAEVAIVRLIERWAELGIVFQDDGRHVHVAVEAHNQVLMRVAHRHGTAEAEPSTREVRHAAAVD